MAIEASSQLAVSDLISITAEHSETMDVFGRIEEMLIRLIAERRAPPTPDPPDPHTECPRSVVCHQIGTIQSRIDPISPTGVASRLLDVEFPNFNGTLMREWISQCEQAFFLERTPPEMKVHRASIHFAGQALHWHLNYIQNRYGLYPSWPDYIIDISSQFGTSWDANIIDHTCWVGSNDVIDWNAQKIADVRDEPIMVEDEPPAVKESSSLTAYQVFDKMSMHLNEVIEVSGALPKDSEKSMDDDEEEEPPYQAHEEPPKSGGDDPTDPALAKELFNSIAHQVFDEWSPPTKSEEIEISKEMNENFQLLSFLAGNSLIDIVQVATNNCEESLCFNPGGERLLVVGYSLLRLLPKPRCYNSSIAKESISEVTHHVLDKMFALMESNWDRRGNKLINIRVLLFDLSELQLVFYPGISEKWIKIVVATPDKLIDILKKTVLLMSRATYLDLNPGGELSCVHSPWCHISFNDDDDLLCFDDGGEELVAEYTKESIVASSESMSFDKKGLSFTIYDEVMSAAIYRIGGQHRLLPFVQTLGYTEANSTYDGLQRIVFDPGIMDDE